ncbi:hypothetical protein K474DRAFT_1663347 [Panus rudis PR-1116 ss-1]|nr:hypothetical protein K474DRAFT_1663347 [Panus rudis PR-1116 ss-1]
MPKLARLEARSTAIPLLTLSLSRMLQVDCARRYAVSSYVLPFLPSSWSSCQPLSFLSVATVLQLFSKR